MPTRRTIELSHEYVKPRLEPEEALAAPLYTVAALLIVIPVGDFLLTVPPPELFSNQWRFSTVGLLSSHLLTPIIGLGLAFGLSGLLKQFQLARILVLVCLTMGVGLAGLCAVFLRDMMLLAASIPPNGRPAFDSAWQRATLKCALSSAALLYVGWGARRMIPARNRQRSPKPVHVVSK